MKKIRLLVFSLIAAVASSSALYAQNEKGYFLMAELGYRSAAGSIEESFYDDDAGYKRDISLDGWSKTGVKVVNGYTFSPIFSAGVGLGYMSIDTPDSVEAASIQGDPKKYGESLHAIPITLYARLNLTKTEVRPYIAVNVGYVATLNHCYDINGGEYLVDGSIFEPQVGVAFNVNNHDVTLGLGYSNINMSFKANEHYEYIVPSGSVLLNIGFVL